jgi:hypothetical protein
MIMQHPLLLEWQQRLAALSRLIEAQSENDWRYEARARVLRYLISRYGHQPVAENPVVLSSSRSYETVAPVGVRDRGGVPTERVEVIRNLLEDIHRRVQAGRRN